MASSSLHAPPRGGLGPVVVISASLIVLALGTVAGAQPRSLALLVLVATALALFHEQILRWDFLIGIVLAVILFVPIKRYVLPGSLPFDFELYRVTIALVIALWIAALLVDERVTLKSSGLGAPLALFALAVGGSIVTNLGRIQALDLSSEVVKKTLFFFSFYLVVFLVASVVRDIRTLHTVLKTLVAGTAVVALFALVERRSGYNVFDHLQSLVPFLQLEYAERNLPRAGRLRVYASAQTPIALAVLLAMMIPLAVYVARLTRRWWWALAAIVIALGLFATVSRSGVLALAAIGAVFVWLRPREMKALLPLALPLLLAVHIATPGAIGGLRQAFFPSAGLIEDQTVYGGRLSGDRIDPQFEIIKTQPFFGQGFGTRLVEGPVVNARILDNQWLGTAVETGLVGVVAFIWLFFRFIRRLGREAKEDRSARGWLLVSFASAAAAFAVTMFTYDAFSFIQITFVLFIMLGLGMAVLRSKERWSFAEPASRRRVLP